MTKQGEKEERKPAYEKPLFEEGDGMKFTEEIWEKFNAGQYCLQCSGCHGCM